MVVKVLVTRLKNHSRFWGNKLLIYIYTAILPLLPQFKMLKGMISSSFKDARMISSLVKLFLNGKKVTGGERLRRVKFNDLR